jgi:hypothetical protein
MKSIKSLLLCILFVASSTVFAQTPSFEELEFEADSISSVYKPSGKNSVLIKSKRGNSGLNKTPAADAILNLEVSEIVLVFSETESSDIAEREEANQERWENLLKTYPELFQFSTTYKNICQCKIGGNPEAFKQSQGFYVYINGELPKMAETPVEEPKAVVNTQPAKTEEKKAEVKKTEVPVAANTQAGKVAEPIKEVPAPESTPAKTNETPTLKDKKAKESPKEAFKETDVPATTKTVTKENENPVSAPTPAKTATKQKPSSIAKSRKSKDPKACRMACYESGQESLDAFFKDNIKLSRKQRRVAKKQMPVVKLQLNVDGSIKKVLVTCPDEKLNLIITEAVKSMNPWNATVKNGATVKSEVKITLKYDKKSKSMKAEEVAVTPRLAPKCKCVSDSDLFD